MNAGTRTSERWEEGTVNRLSRSESQSGAAPLPRGAREGSGAAPDARYRFLARFGATILSGGIAAIPTSLYHYQAQLGLVPQEVWFVGYILAHRWTDALPYPSLRQMGRRTGISTQMLHRYKQSLVEKGYLAIIPRHRPSGGRTSNFYDFSGLFDRLEQLLRGDRRGTAWQPTADDATAGDDLADAEPDGIGDEDADRHATPTTVLTEAVSPSHQDGGAEVVTWQDVLAQGRQRALSAPHTRSLTGAAHAPLPEGNPRKRTAPGTPAAPQESRLSAHNIHKTARRELVPAGIETSKRGLRNACSSNGPVNEPGPAPSSTRADALSIPTDDPAEKCWQAARATLARTISPAAFSAWVSGLTPVALVATPSVAPLPMSSTTGSMATGTATGPQLVLACASNFQREHLERRYRDAIEAALGTRCELVVRSSYSSQPLTSPDGNER